MPRALPSAISTEPASSERLRECRGVPAALLFSALSAASPRFEEKRKRSGAAALPAPAGRAARGGAAGPPRPVLRAAPRRREGARRKQGGGRGWRAVSGSHGASYGPGDGGAARLSAGRRRRRLLRRRRLAPRARPVPPPLPASPRSPPLRPRQMMCFVLAAMKGRRSPRGRRAGRRGGGAGARSTRGAPPRGGLRAARGRRPRERSAAPSRGWRRGGRSLRGLRACGRSCGKGAVPTARRAVRGNPASGAGQRRAASCGQLAGRLLAFRRVWNERKIRAAGRLL